MVFTLDKKATFLALFFSFFIYYTVGYQAVLLLLLFLFVSSLITNYGYQEKKELGIYDYERGIANVLANGIPSLISGLLYFLNPVFGLGAFFGSVSAIMADKFASEIGVLGGEPYSLLGFKKVKKGTSGAVSILGTFMSFVGSAIIGLGALFLYNLDPFQALKITIAGFLGCLMDSFFGIFEEKGFGDKMTTNFICALSGAIFGYLIF